MNWTNPTLAASMLLALCACHQALATSMPLEEAQPWPEVETVRTLLRADAAAALADCSMPGICPPAPAAKESLDRPARPADDIRVAAIFGSTRRLNVDVLVNGALLRYRAGHGAPIAGAVSQGAYRLMAVEGACVRLRRDDLDHIACVGIGGAQP